jgi:capsid portal protein
MHRIILGLLPGLLPEVDHVNGKPADNRRSNLRTCTRTENNHNRHAFRGNTGYKGVHFNKRQRKFVAYITVNGQMKYLGQYATPEAGALVYNRAAREHHGGFACLNRAKLVLNLPVQVAA